MRIYTLVNSALRSLSFPTVQFTFMQQFTFGVSLFSRFHQQALVEVKILEHLRKKVSKILKITLFWHKKITLSSKR